ncbi:MAG TPA: twin-arginine translocase TatA/TatE family subunit [Thermoanaerobaculia bacterium]|nr:twin-arginine translocase TatA/TatE family subunit [Thermoanaerobaculia bacterium]
MFGFGGLSEVLFILFLAMLIFGPAKMPEIARMLAKGLAEVRKASNELKRTLNAELAISEQEKEAARLDHQAAAPFPPPPPPAPPSWSGGETVPQLDAPGAPQSSGAPASSGAPESSEPAGGSQDGASSEAAAGSSEAAAGSGEGSASNERPAGSEVALSSDDAALTTDAAYYAAWPEDGSSPHGAADSTSPERAATATTAAPDGRHSA